MEKTNIYLLAGLTFLLGLFLALSFHVANPVVLHDVQNVTVTKEVPVEKIVNVSVPFDSNANLVASAFDEYQAEVADKDSLQVINGVDYSVSELTFGDLKNVKVDKDTSNRKDNITTVSFDVKVIGTDKSDAHPSRATDSVVVVFHSKTSLDTEVSVDRA